eukprot:c23969_g2_i1 orf=637-834(+)
MIHTFHRCQTKKSRGFPFESLEVLRQNNMLTHTTVLLNPSQAWDEILGVSAGAAMPTQAHPMIVK